MTIKPMKIVGALFLMGAVANANALGVSLVATSNTTDVAVGDFINLDIVMDFAAEPTLGGGFNISYDDSSLALAGFNNNNIGTFSNRDPDLLPGLLQAWAFADFGGLGGPLLVGSVSFEVIAAADSMINITEDVGGTGGAFTSAVTFAPYAPGSLDFQGVAVTAASQIPVPAAVWFMLSGLGALFGFGRKAA